MIAYLIYSIIRWVHINVRNYTKFALYNFIATLLNTYFILGIRKEIGVIEWDGLAERKLGIEGFFSKSRKYFCGKECNR